MPCENHREALIEAAAADTAPSRELRSHLDACQSCRTVFTEQLQFFAAIDAGVRATANAEVPTSFLPRVRDRLENARVSQPWARPSLIFAAAGVAFVLAFLIPVFSRHALKDNQAKQILVTPSREKPETLEHLEGAGLSANVISSRPYGIQQRKRPAYASSAPSARLEVIVPPDEREALARFVAALQEQSDVAVALVVPVSAHKDESLSLEPLKIAELEVKPLQSLASEVPDDTEEKH